MMLPKMHTSVTQSSLVTSHRKKRYDTVKSMGKPNTSSGKYTEMTPKTGNRTVDVRITKEDLAFFTSPLQYPCNNIPLAFLESGDCILINLYNRWIYHRGVGTRHIAGVPQQVTNELGDTVVYCTFQYKNEPTFNRTEPRYGSEKIDWAAQSQKNDIRSRYFALEENFHRDQTRYGNFEWFDVITNGHTDICLCQYKNGMSVMLVCKPLQNDVPPRIKGWRPVDAAPRIKAPRIEEKQSPPVVKPSRWGDAGAENGVLKAHRAKPEEVPKKEEVPEWHGVGKRGQTLYGSDYLGCYSPVVHFA
jgi:hypothetical protein